MPLVRKARVSGKSIIITLPSQIVEAYGIKNSDFLEILPLEQGAILLKKTVGKGGRL